MFNYFHIYTCQVAQVLLTLPYSFSQLGMLSGTLFQLFYGLLGGWTAYLISALYVEYRTRKEREKFNFRNHVIQVPLSHSQILNIILSLCNFLYILRSQCMYLSVFNTYNLTIAVVWGSWWAPREALEKRGLGLQLHISSIWICYPTHSLCKVSSNIINSILTPMQCEYESTSILALTLSSVLFINLRLIFIALFFSKYFAVFFLFFF